MERQSQDSEVGWHCKSIGRQFVVIDVDQIPCSASHFVESVGASIHFSRMAGEDAAFDMFISYRVASDHDHALHLHKLLTECGLKVWLGVLCLESGKERKEGFCAGLCNSKACVSLFHENQNDLAQTPDSLS